MEGMLGHDSVVIDLCLMGTTGNIPQHPFYHNECTGKLMEWWGISPHHSSHSTPEFGELGSG